MNFFIPLLSAAALFATTAFAQTTDKAPVNAGPYVPSPTSVVADMLALAEVGRRTSSSTWARATGASC